MKRRYRLSTISLILEALLISGCAAPAPYTKTALPPGVTGIYHKVEAGQTLWKISKTYGVSLEEITAANHIQDASVIEKGQLILIPGRKKTEYIPAMPACASDDFIWPLRGGKVITGFGQILNSMVNKGLNIRPYVNTEVFASRSGKVVFYADSFGGFGKTIIIDHGDGFSTVYSRLAQVYIKLGDYVKRGAPIAQCGWAGRNKEVYLHFEIRKGSAAQNPYFYLSTEA